MEVEMKICSKCEEAKARSEFYRDKNKKDGHESQCKKCREESKIKHKENNRERLKEYHFKYNLTYKNPLPYDKKKQREINKNYNINNRKRITEQRNKRRREDVAYKINQCLRSRILSAIKKDCGVKSHKTMALIGCDILFLKKYIKSKFTKGMSWDNYGRFGWHIDHIRPCSSFDLTDPEQQKQCFHYSNLQPLWAEDNLSKSDKWAG